MARIKQCGILIAVAATIVFAMPLLAAPKTGLPRAMQVILDQQIVPAYLRGDSLWLVRSLSDLVARATPERVALIDQSLAEEKIPPVSQLLLEARLSLVLQGQSQVLPKPHPREILLTIEPVKKTVEEILASADEVAILADKDLRATTFDAFEKMFWDAHVYRNRLRTASMLTDYGQAMVDEAKGLRPSLVPSTQRHLLDADFASVRSQLLDVNKKLEERSLRLRLKRLEFAASVDQRQAPFTERLRAAFVGDLDGALLEEFFSQHGDYPFEEESLRGPGVLRDVQVRAQRVRQESGDLVRKGRLLFEGLHWWLRGRYGQGPEGNGMLKSPLALTHPAALFALYMPTETPHPTDPYDLSQYPVPEIDRRHHHIWQFEYRRIGEQNSVTESTDTKTTSRKSVTKFDRFY